MLAHGLSARILKSDENKSQLSFIKSVLALWLSLVLLRGNTTRVSNLVGSLLRKSRGPSRFTPTCLLPHRSAKPPRPKPKILGGFTARPTRAFSKRINQSRDFIQILVPQPFPSLLNAFSLFIIPSVNPTAFAKLFASSYFFLASDTFPSISANSPKLCVATAHPISHSSLRSGGCILAATARAFCAHIFAFETSAARVGGFWPGVGGGSC